MATNVERLKNSRVKLTVNIDAERLEKTIDEAYRRTAKRISVPGFRKGKAPRKIIELNYGPDVFTEDALDILLPRTYEEAVEETKIQPVEQPRAGVEEFERGVGATLTFEVDVYPELELGEYKNLKVEREIIRIGDEDVQKVLEEQQERSAQLVVADRAVVKEGDFVILDFLGFIDGQPFSGGAAEERTLEVGSGQFIPGFEEQLVGMEVNESKEIEVTFPQDYHAEHLAGKDAVFQVTIKELKEKVLPAIDDEFAKDISEFDTLDELKAEIRKNLEDEAARRTTAELKNKLLGQIAENSSVEIPRSMITHQAQHLAEYFLENMRRQGFDGERFLEMSGQDKEEFRARFEPQAETQIIHDLILESVTEIEGITVSEEEVNNKIEEYIGSTSELTPELKEHLHEYWESQRKSIELSIGRDKAMQVIIDSAEISDVEAKETRKAGEA